MAGFANSPLVVTPYGTGTPDAATAPPSDSPTGARYLDPWTKDYVYATDGEYERMPITRQRVLLAVGTLARSSTVDPRGLDAPKKMDATWDRRMRIAVLAAIRPLVEDGSLILHAVLVDRDTNPGRATVTIDYTDKTTGQRDGVTF